MGNHEKHRHSKKKITSVRVPIDATVGFSHYESTVTGTSITRKTRSGDRKSRGIDGR